VQVYSKLINTKESRDKPNLLQAVKKGKLSFYGYLLWKEGSCMEKEIIRGTSTTPGQRQRGRPKTYWHNNIMKRTGLSGDSLLRSVEDRTQWRKIVHEVVNPRIEDD